MTAVTQAGGPPGGAVDEGLKREVGFLGLMWASEGSIIGSGWLFGALTATILAGPAVVFSWIIASLIVILLALIHAELGGIFHVSGGTSRFPPLRPPPSGPTISRFFFRSCSRPLCACGRTARKSTTRMCSAAR